MLVLSRQVDESVQVGDDMILTVIEIGPARRVVLRVIWDRFEEAFTLDMGERREILPFVTVENRGLWRSNGRVSSLGFTAPNSITIMRCEVAAERRFAHRPA